LSSNLHKIVVNTLAASRRN